MRSRASVARFELGVVGELERGERLHRRDVRLPTGRADDDVAGHETPELWGLVSDLDVAVGVSAGIDDRCARDVAVEPLVTVRSNDRLHAAQLMAEHGVAHLAVLDSTTDRPAGVVSTLDIAEVAAS
jgi:CBS domain-containing protein